MSEMTVRALERRDWAELAELICAALNYWHATHGRGAVFTRGPEACSYMAEIYEALDPGCCVVAERPGTERLMGACFWHPRETHVSLGIMAVHPNYMGMGVASRLLRYITDLADAEGKPTRLVSSAINVDSFSLYNRAGFVPIEVYQDMVVEVPGGGLGQTTAAEGVAVRAMRAGDVEAMVALEERVSGIRRPKDYRFFLAKPTGDWSVSVVERAGKVAGFLTTLRSPRGASAGPGVAEDAAVAEALLARELDGLRGKRVLVLVPCRYRRLVERMYAWGARNVEVHLAQVKGAYKPIEGVTLPTFMPESG